VEPTSGALSRLPAHPVTVLELGAASAADQDLNVQIFLAKQKLISILRE
jgi:hypothetical protein